MIQVANQAVSDAKVVTHGLQEDNPQAETMRQAAAVMDKAATEMNAIEVTDETLQDYQDSFANMYRDMSQAMRDFAVAFEQKDRQAAEAAQMKLQQATTPEKQLVDDLNAYCSGQ
jgi:phosphate uptake regulator